MAINQTISQFPAAPDSATDTPQEFNVKANAFVNHQSATYVGEVNQWATEANAVQADINTKKTEIENIVATIPDGQINDNTPSTVNTYSSQKIENTFGKLGAGQNWVDVTSSRTLDTTYTNDTGRDILIYYSIKTKGGTAWVLVNGTLKFYGTTLINTTAYTTSSPIVIIPNGSTYSYNGTGAVSINGIYEFR